MIVLDTHIFLWLHLEPERLPLKIVTAIKTEDQLGISAISLWETAMLNSRKRIFIPGPLIDWLRMAIEMPKFRILPLTLEIAARSESLPIHGDPADRIIAAIAMEHDCALATCDQRLRDLLMVKTIS